MNEPSEKNQTEATAIDSEALEQIEVEAAAVSEPASELMVDSGPTTAEIIRPVIDLGCAVACPNWNIQGAEREALAEAYGALVDKYFPDGVSQFGVELNALLVTAAIFTPRIGQPRFTPEPEQEKKQEVTTNAD